MGFISGEDREQTLLFPGCIDEYIDEASLVRVIEAYVNSLNLAALGFSRFEPESTGRPPYDPKDMLKLYVYGYMNRIRSSRRLEAESKRNLEVFWLLRKLTPDHKTIANFRKDNPESLKNVFRDFVKLCIKLDLYGKELAAIDGSKFKAVNSKDRAFTKKKLEDRLKRIDEKITKYLAALDKADLEETKVETEKSAEEIARIIKALEERKARYEGYAEELESTGETQKVLTDSESRLMPCNGKIAVCYNVQTAVDSKNKLVIDFEVTNKTNDLNQLTPMVKQVKDILETEELAVTVDAGYNSATDIAEAVQCGVTVHAAETDYNICIPAAESEAMVIESQSNGKCVYVKERNIAICSMGKILYPKGYRDKTGEAVFYNYGACKACSCRCTASKKELHFQIVMPKTDFSKEYNDKDLAVKQVHIKPDKEVYKQRKSLAEHPFGTIKQSMDAGYCLLKGKRKVRGEFSLIFLAYNLKRVINILGSKNLIQKIKHLAYPA